MVLNILLIDPSQEWLDSASNFLKEKHYKISSVTNGKDGQITLYNEHFFAVILNYDTQNHSALQVLKFIKINLSAQRVILILESNLPIDNEEISVDKLIKLGATEVLIKPFAFEVLAETLEGHQTLGDLVSSLPKREGVSEEVEVKASDDEFVEIKIEEFYSSKAVLFNVFIKLSSGRYVKILHAGDSFQKDRIDKYKKEKNIDCLYFQKPDRRKYIQFTNRLAKKLIKNEAVPSSNKVNMLKNVSEKFVEETFAVGLKPQVVQQGKEICINVYNMVEKQDDLYKVLRDYQDFDPNAFTHAYLVTLFTSSIIKQFDWQSKTTIETTALACMFHDIGKTQLPEAIRDKKRHELNDEELEVYKTHSTLGAGMVDGHIMMNHSVKQIILQHHEYYDGTGFPTGIRGNRIVTLANIVCLANDFVGIIMRDSIKPVEALKVLLKEKDSVKRYHSMILENFIKVFADPDKIRKENALPGNSRVVPSKKAS